MKIAFVSLPVMGHLNPMTTLARKLQSRGHDVLFIGVPDAEPVVRAAKLKFESYCEEEYPLGSMGEIFAPHSRLRGFEVIKDQVDEISPKLLQASLKHLPQKLVETGVEAVVFDAAHVFLQLVPMSLGIPYIQVWNNLHLDFSGAVPPTIFGWPHETSAEARARNLEGVKIMTNLFAPMVAVAQAYAKENGLQIDWNDPSAITSKLAVITQTPREFDFPGTPWPAYFYYAGPFHDDDGREPVAFPWEKLTGEPVIYASLGTLVNGQPEILRTILGAAAKLAGFQVVLSVGKNVNPDELGPVPANTLVVRNAPQIELLKRAALCITHAGLNTTLEALAQGLPLVAIPIGYDQPGVAARIAHHGVGEFMQIEDLTSTGLSRLIAKVLLDPSYSSRAEHFRRVIAKTRALDLAADVIERAFATTAGVPQVNAMVDP
jgi:zeaxanthin glucosyltransferase